MPQIAELHQPSKLVATSRGREAARMMSHQPSEQVTVDVPRKGLRQKAELLQPSEQAALVDSRPKTNLMLRNVESDLPAAWHLNLLEAGRGCMELFQRTQSSDLIHINVEHVPKFVAEC